MNLGFPNSLRQAPRWRLPGALPIALGLSLLAGSPSAEEGLLMLPAPPDGRPPEMCRPVAGAGRALRLHETFRDDFDAFDPYGGRWTPHFDHNGYRDWRSRTLAGNGEAQLYVDPRYSGSGSAALGLDPFRAENGLLRVAARPAPPDATPFLHGFRYVSGMLSSRASFLQAHGYFEIRARMPSGAGTWPAFWLLAPGRWPPEIDVLEFRGGDPALHVHLHWSEQGAHRSSGCRLPVPDAAARFHSYGVLWTPEGLTWYLDRTPVAWIATKPGLDQPMYLLANLAIGGWAGPPDPATPFPATYEIDRIAAYAIEDER
jgi:beta-glucanase (GH16 family)